MESKRLDNAAQAAELAPVTSMRTANRSLLVRTPKDVCWMPCTNRRESVGCPGAEREGLYRRQKDAAGGGRARRVQLAAHH